MEIKPEYTKKEVNCRFIKCLLIFFKEKVGKKELVKFLEDTGLTLDYLEDENNWISYSIFCELLAKYKNYFHSDKIIYEAGLYSAHKEAWGLLYILAAHFSSPSYAFRKMIELQPRYDNCAQFTIHSSSKNSMAVSYAYFNGFEPNEDDCVLRQASLASIPLVWKLPKATVIEKKCALKSPDKTCEYEISWVHSTPIIYPAIGLFAGLLLSFFFLFIQHWQVTPHYLTFLIPVLAGWVGWSFVKDRMDKKVIKNNVNFTEDQNAALEESVNVIEKNYDDLQDAHQELRVSNKNLEETYQELNQYKDHLEELVESRTKELQTALVDLTEAQTQLVHSEKMASLGVLTAGMAHEAYNPLTACLSSTSALQNYFKNIKEGVANFEDLEAKCARATGRIQNGLKRVENIITNLKRFSRKDIKGIKPNNINEGIEATIELMQDQLHGNIIIHKNLVCDQFVECDLGGMNQVFLNIIQNAIQALAGRGDIWVTTRVKDNLVDISIQDNASGIPEDVLSHIFEPFYTTKEVGEGTGLGLSISQKIVLDHHGEISVSSKIGQGSSFSIVLPLKQPPDQ